ncbi:DUF7521 family protein [Halorubrum tibetense]|uniref:Uncharacterized protein n=1 Tax=Halorubrum tibetense TaxID=175631 RepID=A0ABD5S6J7_9EURY
MANTALWMFIVSNLLVFTLGSVLTVLSYRAQKRLDQDSLKYTTLGFGLITASIVAEALYAPGIGGGDWLVARHLLVLYTMESLFIAAGLGCIAYSLLSY